MENWTYECDRIDPEVTVDDSTQNRFTFNRYLYFKPNSYESWIANNISGMTYSAELIDAEQIPSAGTYLSGSLSSFYLNRVTSITNMNKEENPNATSYGVVTLEYENKPAANSGSKGTTIEYVSADEEYEDGKKKDIKPWQQRVNDFTQTTFEISVPFLSGYNISGQLIPVQTSARQAYSGVTTSIYGCKYTWTYNTINQNENYSISSAMVNDIRWQGVGVLSGHFDIPVGCGLLLPPTFKVLYYNNPDTASSTRYYQWGFEVLSIPEPYGQYLELYNAGTRAWDSVASRAYDICTWYTQIPSAQVPPLKYYGNFKDMITQKRAVETFNKTALDADKRTFTGDFVNQPVPLTATGGIDINALNGGPKLTNKYLKYKPGRWLLAWR